MTKTWKADDDASAAAADDDDEDDVFYYAQVYKSVCHARFEVSTAVNI
jgi:hypothetical protein